MTGLIKRSMVVAAVMLTATFAYAGDLKPAPGGAGGGNTMHPAPQGSKETGMTQREENANENASFKSGNSDSDKDKVRRLRPVN